MGKKDKKIKKEDVAVSEPATTENPPKSAQQQQPKKKKKNAPDRPQPAWLFPPDDENPVLNPRDKSNEQKKKEIEERFEAIKFLKHKAANAPNKPQPPSLLLQLIGAFLGEFGFNSTGRMFTLERKARKRMAGWEDEIGAKLPKGMPILSKIFQDWHAEWDVMMKEEEDTTSSEEGSEEDVSDIPEEASSNDSDDSDDSDKPKKSKAKDSKSKTKANSKGKAKVKAESESPSSSSESDANDDDLQPTSTSKPTVNGLLDKLKARQNPVQEQKPVKASSPASPDSDSDSESSSSEDEPAAKDGKAKPVEEKKQVKVTAGSSTSSSASDSSSDSDPDERGVPATDTAAPLTVKTQLNGQSASDSSRTLLESPQKDATSASTSESSSETSSSSSDEDEKAVPVKASVTKKRKLSDTGETKETTTTAVVAKVSKKNNAPFQRVAADTKVDPKFASNKYVPYDYAQRAHQDLIVTKGKGFTKEKNKKKRGSYRGGQIDLAGGKGVKFDD